jgi:dipeptidyl aminopeptidase/acylaminoacyl peptidase
MFLVYLRSCHFGHFNFHLQNFAQSSAMRPMYSKSDLLDKRYPADAKFMHEHRGDSMKIFHSFSYTLLLTGAALGNSSVAAPAANSAAAARAAAREAVADSQRVTPGGISELKAIEINGIKQWISIRGNDPRNPILLFLHGGPGSPMMAESWTFQKPWEDFFTVVQWDQRGAGKTFGEAGRKVDPSMTVDQMQADAEAVVDWLRRTYQKPKIFLLGHSWGSILGVKVAQHHPEWLYA